MPSDRSTDIDDSFLDDFRRQLEEAEGARGSKPPKPAVADVLKQRGGESRIEDYLAPADGAELDSTDSQFGSGDRKLDELLKHHAPRDWRKVLPAERITRLLFGGETMTMVVLAADIRKSTLVMRETIDFREFAHTISEFVGSVARFIRWGRGWFDKFTGDGLLAYWLVPDPDHFPDYVESALRTSYHILKQFSSHTIPRLKNNARNFPGGVGMSVGLDAGPAHLVTVAHTLTVVGHPVVGAVRMCSAAEPGQLMCNLRVGEEIYRRRHEFLAGKIFDVIPQMGSTKEYEAQETYLVEFLDLNAG